ncbi:MAG: 30S ribosomal protein S3 [Candidatus Goldbacteria bacterium]|nr:30S ribosomal protein S3 [Candidatus Goldiibacteriota bacterium]
MGQKVHPEGLRLGIIKDWKSKWVAKKNFKDILLEDYRIREFIKDRLYNAGISKIEIERAGNKAIVKIYTAKPGMIIGKKGTEVEEIRKELEKMTGKQILIEPKEIKKPEIDAQLIAENIAQQIEKRVSYRWAMKKAMQTALQTSSSQNEESAKGIKICVSGRLQGAEIARSEWYVEGRVPLQTLRADIDYGFAIAKTTYGTIGVKVWVFKGEKI